MMQSSLSRRTLLGLTAGGVLASVAGCGGGARPTGQAGAGGAPPADGATWWSLSGTSNEKVHKDAFTRYNGLSDKLGTVQTTFFANDAYKQKLRTALGAGQAPTMIYGWGGGSMRTWAQDGQVEDLTPWLDQNADFKNKFTETLWEAATTPDGKIYSIPVNGTQPIVLFYNKKIFADAGAKPPTTWDELMALVELFKGKGIAPFALAGQSRWTSMMWLEYLLDRVGGPEVFRNIFDKRPDAWLDDAVVQAAQRAQELVRAEAFPKGFASMAADSNTDVALLWTGKAAMMLQGGWTYGVMKQSGGDFVSGGNLGFTSFPTIPGGKGKLDALVGNPSNYISIYAKHSEQQRQIAKDSLIRGLWAEQTIDDWIATGVVPGFKGVESKFTGTPDEPYLKFLYDSLNSASSFTQSWDQALDPTAAEALLVNIEELFLLKITPQEFAQKMNAVKV
ncbi:sugar ABC transporter substrate-binding protein [Enemella evansiae]|nr:sugar ABC transporter substrate-binding protein [Enemella evansiae]